MISSTPGLDHSDLITIRGVEVIFVIRMVVAVYRDETTMGVAEDSEASAFARVTVEAALANGGCTHFLFLGCV
jgi:hypothetical protein